MKTKSASLVVQLGAVKFASGVLRCEVSFRGRSLGIVRGSELTFLRRGGNTKVDSPTLTFAKSLTSSKTTPYTLIGQIKGEQVNLPVESKSEAIAYCQFTGVRFSNPNNL